MRIIGPINAEELFRGWDRRLQALERNGGQLARHKPYPTDQRPDPAVTATGTCIVDLDLGKPIWCINAIWVDATGTAV